MKKHFKQTLSLILSLMMIMSMFAGLDIISFAEDDILSYLTYEIKDGEVTITKCDTSISGDVVIPDTIEGYPVAVIGSDAFAYCDNLESVIIPETVTKIGASAFFGCRCLKNISLPDTLKEIGYYAFAYCVNLESVYIPDSVKEIGARAFAYCRTLEKVNLPKGISNIKERTFYVCEKLGNLEIPEGVKDIELFAFADCENLTAITIPHSTTNIIDGAFYDCIRLTDITVLNSEVEIGSEALGFFIDYEAGKSNPVDGAVIYGYADSTAEKYAKENGITFIAIEPEEPPVEKPPVEEPPVEKPPVEEPPVEKPPVEEPPVEEPPVEEPPVEEPPVEEPPVEEPPVEEPPVEEPPVEEPPVEKPVDDGKLDVKDEGGIVTDFDNKISQIGTEETATTLSEMIENENFTIVDKNGKALTEKDLVGTGSKIQILDNDGNVVNEYTILVPTDVDGNGKTTAADARLALRVSAKLENLEGVYAMAAEVTDDSKINASDARKILRISAGLE